MALREQIKEAIGDSRSVGLANNGDTRFQCGTCEYYEKNDKIAGNCHNKHPKLSGKPVMAEWCCNLYNHDKMKVIIE